MQAPEFTALVERHTHELRVHCYRMLGSLDEAEDLVQETFLRAWRGLAGFEGRSSVRAWLYRIATNACLDVLDGRPRRELPQLISEAWDPADSRPPRTDIAWLQPFPDRLWGDPAEAVLARETIELAFLAAIQHLPPRQRAVLILRDVVGWSAAETAATLESSVASANSALQRARATLRRQLPDRRAEWTRAASESELAVLRRYMAAVEQGDLGAIADVLAEDVRTSMPPFPMWFAGRDAVLRALATSWDPGSAAHVGRLQLVATGANGQPAVGGYADGAPFAIGVLEIRRGRIREIVAFHDPALFAAFGLPPALHR